MKSETSEVASMDNLLKLVYANHVREIMSERQCDVKHAFIHVNDIKAIRDFIRETVEFKIQRSARNAYISQLCNADWRRNELKTEKWKDSVSKMVTSMNRVEDWFNKTL